MPRPRFQIHLSTGLALMFVAAVIVYFNTKYLPQDTKFETFGDLRLTTYASGGIGWPSAMIIHTFKKDTYEIVPSGLAINALVLLSILSVVAAVSEFLIRRRTSKTPPIPEAIQ